VSCTLCVAFGEPAIGNVVRRVMAAVRDEAMASGRSTSTHRPSMQSACCGPIHISNKNPRVPIAATRRPLRWTTQQRADNLPGAFYVGRSDFKQTIMGGRSKKLCRT
jgi:hypothetical protein